jgi:hypothetical protein
MVRFSTRWMGLGLALLTLLPSVPASAATAATHGGFSGTCQLDITLMATGLGSDTKIGPVLLARDVPVAGLATLTLPTGDVLTGPVTGKQTVISNLASRQADVVGEMSGSANGGSLTLGYTAHVDLAGGSYTGSVFTLESSGTLAGFEGTGSTSGPLLGPLAVHGSGSTHCQQAG